jgi:hypothetical protein
VESDRRLQASSELRSWEFRKRAEKESLGGSDSKLAECVEDLAKEANCHPYFASPVAGRHARGMRNDNGDPNWK